MNLKSGNNKLTHKYNLNDEVFIYEGSIKKGKIKGILIEEDGVSYFMEGQDIYIDGFYNSEYEIGSTLEELKENVLLEETINAQKDALEKINNALKEYDEIG